MRDDSYKLTVYIPDDALAEIKSVGYKLCLGKKVNGKYNVVFYASNDILYHNKFEFKDRYRVFGTKSFKGGDSTEADTKKVPILSGQTVPFNFMGVFGAVTGPPDASRTFKVINKYNRPIHFGVDALVNDEYNTAYVSDQPFLAGDVYLEPKRQFLLWFAADVETGTMVTNTITNCLELDFTDTNNISVNYTVLPDQPDRGTWLYGALPVLGQTYYPEANTLALTSANLPSKELITQMGRVLNPHVPAVSEIKLICHDILSSEKLKEPENGDDTQSGGGARAVLVPLDTLWDNGSELTYTFVEEAGDDIQQNKVATVIKEWQKYANIIFKRVDTPSDATIRISFAKGSGNYTFAGKQLEGVDSGLKSMNLESVTSKTINPTDWERSCILHEFGHTLGLLHEHQSPARIGVLDWEEKVVYEESGWDRQTTKRQIINVLRQDEYSNYTKLDLKSVMMYWTPASHSKQRIEVGVNSVLSQLDKAFIQIHYPFFGTGPEDMSFDKALQIMGLDGEERDVLIHHYRNGKWKDIRRDFRTFADRRRAAQK